MPTVMKQTPFLTWCLDLGLLVVILSLLSFLLLGTRPLFAPDEGRYAEIAREMVRSGHFVTPYLNGIKYFEKPPLFYWLTALAIKVGGPTVWAVRWVSAIIGIIGCLATYCAGRLLFTRKTGWFAALILATSGLYFTMDHTVSLDCTVTVFMSISLYGILLAMQSKKVMHSRLYAYLAAIAAALAVLTKGLIGLVFPGLIVLIWLTLTHQFWGVLKKLYLPTSCLIFLIIALPWHILVQLHNPEFFNFYFINQQILRYTEASVGHYQPIWFFIPILIAGFLPWIIFLPKAAWQAINHPTRLFFLVWAIVIFVFFSFSKSKLIPYILPLFPAIAMLVGEYLQRSKLSFRLIISLFIVMGIVMLLGLVIIPRYQTRSILPLVNIIQPLLKNNAEIITYHIYYQDLPFYLQRRITIVDWQNELTFGMQHQDTHEWMINDQTLLKRLQSNTHPIFVLMSNDDLAHFQTQYPQLHYKILGKTPQNVVIEND